jgi:hypothetical protein
MVDVTAMRFMCVSHAGLCSGPNTIGQNSRDTQLGHDIGGCQATALANTIAAKREKSPARDLESGLLAGASHKGRTMIKFSMFVWVVAVAGCATDDEFTYQPGPDRSTINGKADTARVYAASYTCNGGTGDVSIAVEKKTKALYIQNTEAGARFVAHSKSHGVYRFVADENDPFTDTGLMGSDATASVATFTGAKTIRMALLGGESAASYTCTLD